MCVVNVFSKDSHGLRIGFGLKLKTALLENKAEFCIVGNNPVVDNDEIRVGVGANGMTINFGWRAMSGPSGMGDRDLGYERLVDIERGRRYFLTEASDLADFLEEDNCSGLIAINTKTGGIVASVFLTSETSAENLEDLFATLKMR
jgi:hypothetical protein